MDTTTIGAGVRVSYQDMANPRRTGTVTGRYGGGDFGIRWDDDGSRDFSDLRQAGWQIEPGHSHVLGSKIDGLSRCLGTDAEGARCDYSEYDSQWGAGIFNDWPRGHHKPYGA